MGVPWERVGTVNAQLGEGPHWDAESGRLLWVDITGRKLHVYHPASGAETSYSFERMVSAVLPDSGGGFLLAMQDGVYRFDEESGESATLREIAPIESELPRNRLNDAKCDRAGRLWVGSMSMDNEPNAGGLYVLETDGRLRQALSGVGCSNGLAWDGERKTMYYIDTPTRRVDRFAYDEATGEIDRRETVIRFPEFEGLPDGMTIDSEGMLWIAHWGGGRVSRWNPQCGEKLSEIELPAPLVTSCVFGGEQLDELYVTTAREGLKEATLLHYPLSGSLFKLRPGVKGTASRRYGAYNERRR